MDLEVDAEMAAETDADAGMAAGSATDTGMDVDIGFTLSPNSTEMDIEILQPGLKGFCGAVKYLLSLHRDGDPPSRSMRECLPRMT